MDEKRKKKLVWQLPFLTLLIVGTILIIRQQQSMPYQKNTGLVFGTTYSVTYQYDHDIQSEVIARLNEVDNALSMFNQQSVITKINQNTDMRPNQMFLAVFQQAQLISQDTDGAFDITVAPLVNLWGFGFKSGQQPTRETVDSLRSLIGYKKVHYDGKHIVKQSPDIMLDCSAIAKGFGADIVAKLFDEKGIKNYLVEIGGEVVTRGISEKRVPWKIGVTKPTEDSLFVGNELQTVLNVTDKAMATSGNYRNFYYKGGKRYAHTIDPKTGYPVQHNILSATVLADHCSKADAYATAFMVMGLERAKRVLERNPDLMAYFIYDNNGQNDVWYSPSLQDKIQD